APLRGARPPQVAPVSGGEWAAREGPVDDVTVRAPRVGDGAGLAETQEEGSAHLADLSRDLFRPLAPDDERAARAARRALAATPCGWWRVAEVDGRVVGYVWAILQLPDSAAQRGGTRYPGQFRVWVNSLIVQQAYARRGIASRLMAAVEEWARER